ncbi:unnamed protein product [Protopolystoma xenopodis]|uniref:Uncharacterized protein n=1 Tax=Protopolystoma xenopodis TaxID=117903 RepID=A0A448XCZ9_9PLAT|nr:unnamed protein product [Protopolystoma xenopodis]
MCPSGRDQSVGRPAGQSADRTDNSTGPAFRLQTGGPAQSSPVQSVKRGPIQSSSSNPLPIQAVASIVNATNPPFRPVRSTGHRDPVERGTRLRIWPHELTNQCNYRLSKSIVVYQNGEPGCAIRGKLGPEQARMLVEFTPRLVLLV